MQSIINAASSIGITTLFVVAFVIKPEGVSHGIQGEIRSVLGHPADGAVVEQIVVLSRCNEGVEKEKCQDDNGFFFHKRR